MKIHIVQKGDTLWKIAQKYGVDFEQLKNMNTHLSNPDMIMPGMKIKIPATGGSVKKEGPKYPKEMPMQKEYPEVEHPFKELKPPTIPVEKEQPMFEQPKEKIKEVPKPMYMPKYPQPTIPEIDINNYYMVNMAKMQVDQTQQTVQPPLQPTYQMPDFDEESPESPAEQEAPVQPQYYPQGVGPMMYPYGPCVPATPVLPGSGFPQPPMPMQYPAMMQPMYMQPIHYQMGMMPTGLYPFPPAPSQLDGEAGQPMGEMDSDESPDSGWGDSPVPPSMHLPHTPGQVEGNIHMAGSPFPSVDQGMMYGSGQQVYPFSPFVAPTGYPSGGMMVQGPIPQVPFTGPTTPVDLPFSYEMAPISLSGQPAMQVPYGYGPGWQMNPPVGSMSYAPWSTAPLAGVPSPGFPGQGGFDDFDKDMDDDD